MPKQFVVFKVIQHIFINCDCVIYRVLWHRLSFEKSEKLQPLKIT
ncbi:hypothetical protein C8J_1193 [Campylobacter jejuni subsp. jejuni 81116]|nr:hypothetical protein C8J_1193 [Campylobacter jejuni subsp. jejuni 81116]